MPTGGTTLHLSLSLKLTARVTPPKQSQQLALGCVTTALWKNQSTI
jgi:hypothetical protein